MKKEKIIKVFSVIPNDFELVVEHFDTRLEAENHAKLYRDGASVVEQELPAKIVDRKRKRIAMYGSRL